MLLVLCTLSFIWFLLSFVSFLHNFSFDADPVWIIHYWEWQLATLQQYIFLFCCYSTSFYCTSEKWLVNLFSKALQKLVKVLQKPNIKVTISGQLCFQIICHSYRLRMKKSNKDWARLKKKIIQQIANLYSVIVWAFKFVKQPSGSPLTNYRCEGRGKGYFGITKRTRSSSDLKRRTRMLV